MALDLIDDPEAVRDAVGVTDADADDTLIYSLMFGSVAEAAVKGLVSDWATILAGSSSEQIIRLKAAAVYYTAALLCLRFESGALGLVSGGSHSDINWKERYTRNMNQFQLMIQQLITADQVVPDPAALAVAPSFAMTRRRKTGPQWQTFPPLGWVGTPLRDHDDDS